LTINGVLEGTGTITNAVTNNGTISVLPGVLANGTTRTAVLDIVGALNGAGKVVFDVDEKSGTIVATGGTLVVGTVAPDQNIVMNGDDTLVLSQAAAFSGTINAKIGDKIILQGQTATSAVDNNGTLVISNGAATVATLKVASGMASDSFTASGSIITIGTAAPVHEEEFDATWYLKQNPDVAASGMDPFTHYDTYGWREGRNPDPFFNTDYYLNQNSDVAAAGIDPLTHYEQYGWKEGRDPSIDFNTNAYLAANPRADRF
jgi:hypothetical protein